MTARRLSSAGRLTIAALWAAALLAPLPARADSLSDPAQAPDASTSSTSSRTWLRDTPKPMTASVAGEPQKPSPWRAIGVLVVLGGLGLSVLAARRHRAASPVLPESATRVRVLSTARVGPKANAVVAEVGGRVLLLGVTDTHVARLAWLDRAELTSKRAAHPSDPVEVTPGPSRAPVETADADEPAPERGIAARFGEILDRALGVRPAHDSSFRGNPGVAALLAAHVEDIVESPRQARAATAMSPSTSIVEDQAAGLARRRRA